MGVRGNRKSSKVGKEDEKGVVFCLLLLVIYFGEGWGLLGEESYGHWQLLTVFPLPCENNVAS